MLQRCVEAILFYHPAVWWLSNRVRRERENCCDDLAVHVCGNRKRYAEALLRLERERSAESVLAVAATGSGTLQRVRRILGLEPSEADWRAAIVAPLIVIVWLSTGFLQPPTVQALEIAAAAPELSVDRSISSDAPTDVIADVLADQPAPPRSTPLGTLAAIIAGPSASVEAAAVPAAVPAEPQTPTPTAGAQPASSPKPGRIQGTLVNAAGEPVSGADVRLTPLTGGMQPGGPAYTAVSDDSGAFVLENITPAPRLGLTARKTGYQLSRYGADSHPAPTVPIPIAEGESLTGLVLVMEQEGVLTGRVLSADGNPITAAIVIVTNTSGARTFPITATTNARGEFRIAGLRPGSYYLAAQNFLGNVTGAASMTTSMTTYYPGVTDRNAATALEISDGKQTTGLEIRIQQTRGYMVRGTLVTVPSGGATVISASPNQPQGQANALAVLNQTGAILEPGGTFALGPLAPGEYEVRATSIAGGKTSIVGTAVITVVDADLSGVTLAPLRTFTVTGKAALEDGTVEQLLGSVAAGRGFGGRGAAAPGAGVTLTLTPRETGGSAAPVRATIGADGTFRFDDVQPGLYTLGAPLFTQTYLKSFMWNGEDVSSSQLKIESGGEINLTYRKGAVRVTGNARGADGKPPAGATALIWPVEPRPARAGDGAWASSIDATGAFAMPAMAPGLYYAAAFPGINGVTALEPRFHRQFNDRATTFEIRENTPVTLDIQAVTAEMVNEALKKPK